MLPCLVARTGVDCGGGARQQVRRLQGNLTIGRLGRGRRLDFCSSRMEVQKDLGAIRSRW